MGNDMTCWRITGLTALVMVAGCANGPAPAPAACTIASAKRAIATEVRETSGLARSHTARETLWTHNDSGNEPILYALATDGKIRTRVTLRGVEVSDWEDLEGGHCGEEYCLYLADIGDNAGARRNVRIYEVVEPKLADREVTARKVIHATYPDGPQDAEALFRLPDGAIFIITKGRQREIKVYRLSSAGVNGQGTLQLVRQVAPRARIEADRVTAATASPDGNWVAFRSYSTLFIYRTQDLLNGGAATITHSLVPLAEKQGESITLDNDGTIWLSSEAEREEDVPTLTGLRCTLKPAN